MTSMFIMKPYHRCNRLKIGVLQEIHDTDVELVALSRDMSQMTNKSGEVRTYLLPSDKRARKLAIDDDRAISS